MKGHTFTPKRFQQSVEWKVKQRATERTRLNIRGVKKDSGRRQKWMLVWSKLCDCGKRVRTNWVCTASKMWSHEQNLILPKGLSLRPHAWELLPYDQYLFRQDPTSEPKAQKRNRRTNMTHTTLNSAWGNFKIFLLCGCACGDWLPSGTSGCQVLRVKRQKFGNQTVPHKLCGNQTVPQWPDCRVFWAKAQVL
jgi:hypothetical protein